MKGNKKGTEMNSAPNSAQHNITIIEVFFIVFFLISLFGMYLGAFIHNDKLEAMGMGIVIFIGSLQTYLITREENDYEEDN